MGGLPQNWRPSTGNRRYDLGALVQVSRVECADVKTTESIAKI
ncbi:MAG: hypothetical protein RLZZ511_3976, partial [Cyanobacteriota bacterium]